MPLLSLPAEVRNQIYFLALTSPPTPVRRTLVTRDLKEPPLLLTNRQIRSEAQGIWRYNTKFLFKVHDCDATLLIKFSNFVQVNYHVNQIPWIVLKRSGKVSWRNLKL